MHPSAKSKCKRILEKTLIGVITIYRYTLSPLLGNCCRFYPSCSVYAQGSIERHGVIQGCFMSIKRILCCHPWHKGGYDPVPEKLKR